MRLRSSSWLTLGLLFGSLVALGACRQEEGKSCQTTTDCKKGLVCCFDGTSASSTLGVCTAGTSCTPRLDAALPDAEVDPDAAQQQDSAVQQDSEAQPDAQTTPDASVTLDASP